MSDSTHGIQYTPASISAPRSTVENIKWLQDQGIEYVRVLWVDLTRVVRFRVLPKSYFLKLLESPRPSVGVAQVAFGLVYLQVAEGFPAMGEYLLLPDLASLRLSPFEPGLATVMGRFEEKVPKIGMGGQSTLEVDLCPRTILQRVVRAAKDLAQVEFLVGFEIEFILLKSTDPVEFVSHHHWTSSDGLRAGTLPARVLREIADGLQQAGIQITMYHAEAAPGQYEIVTEPLLPLAATDALIHSHEIIANVASKHGLRATFAPRVSPDSCGSGAHCHISVHSTSSSAVKPKDKLSNKESSFLSSLLDHLPALAAITLPTPASYKRVVDGVWSGGTYVCWGTENREALIRLTNASSPSSRNFELKCLDGTCNPYLALAGIIGVGIKGVQNKAPLQIKDCPGPLSAAQLGEEERQELGITQRLPLTWEEARKIFAKDKLVEEIFGKNFIDKYLSVNETLGLLLNQDKDERKTLTRLVEFY